MKQMNALEVVSVVIEGELIDEGVEAEEARRAREAAVFQQALGNNMPLTPSQDQMAQEIAARAKAPIAFQGGNCTPGARKFELSDEGRKPIFDFTVRPRNR